MQAQRKKGTKAQRAKGTEQKGFSALCLSHFVPPSLKMSASADSS